MDKLKLFGEIEVDKESMFYFADYGYYKVSSKYNIHFIDNRDNSIKTKEDLIERVKLCQKKLN